VATRADNKCIRCLGEIEPPIDYMDRWFNNLICSYCWVVGNDDIGPEYSIQFDYDLFFKPRKIRFERV
jgi:hypothetical protein